MSFDELSGPEWTAKLQAELRSNTSNEHVGQTLLLENELVKVWHILLQPGERLPFHRHNRSYFWTALSDGTAISHYADGSSKIFNYRKNDIVCYQINEQNSFVHDLNNTGNTVLEFITAELK